MVKIEFVSLFHCLRKFCNFFYCHIIWSYNYSFSNHVTLCQLLITLYVLLPVIILAYNLLISYNKIITLVVIPLVYNNVITKL